MQSNTKYCAKCNKNIYTPNYLIHEAMCRGERNSQLFRSRVIDPAQEFWEEPTNNIQTNPNFMRQNPFKKQNNINPNSQNIQQQQQCVNNNQTGQSNIRRTQTQTSQPTLQSPNGVINPNYGTLNQNPGVIRRNIPANEQKRQQIRPRVEQQQVFPCSFCGYRMTMAELDTHPANCKVKKGQCQFCRQEFPLELMNDHYGVCTSNRGRRAQNQMNANEPPRRRHSQRGNRNQYQQDESVEHYHFYDQQGRQMCSRVTIDAHGNRYTNVTPVGVTNNIRNNQNPFLSFLNMLTQGSSSGGFSFQIGNNQSQNRRHNSEERDAMAFFQMITNLANQMNTVPQNRQPLRKDLLKKLPIVKYDKTNKEHKGCPSCTICVTDFQEGDQLIQLPCGHLFNKECIVPWLKTSTICPNCRQPVKVGTKPSHSNNYEVNNSERQTNNTNRNNQTNTRNQNPNISQNPFRPQQIVNPNQVQTSQIRPITIVNVNQPAQQNGRTNQVTNIRRTLSNNANTNTNPFGNGNRNNW